MTLRDAIAGLLRAGQLTIASDPADAVECRHPRRLFVPGQLAVRDDGRIRVAVRPYRCAGCGARTLRVVGVLSGRGAGQGGRDDLGDDFSQRLPGRVHGAMIGAAIAPRPQTASEMLRSSQEPL